jgi:hypothetical protein
MLPPRPTAPRSHDPEWRIHGLLTPADIERLVAERLIPNDSRYSDFFLSEYSQRPVAFVQVRAP